jgi:hypothetical protein
VACVADSVAFTVANFNNFTIRMPPQDAKSPEEHQVRDPDAHQLDVRRGDGQEIDGSPA